MIKEELIFQIRQQFAHILTDGQEAAVQTFADFLTDTAPHTVMVLRGCAGTGKTTLAGTLVRTLVALRQKVVLMAPTGRAAKVFSLNAGYVASTIHRKIYRQKTMMGSFSLNDNLHQHTLFLVDEASMIANDGGSAEQLFGSGRLLDDLMSYVYSGQGCRMVLIGDKAQLPPVGEEQSPALTGSFLQAYGMKVYECDLEEVLRQSSQSGILWNATMIRQLIVHDQVTGLPQVRFHGFADIIVVPGDELIESLATSYSRVGLDETMVVVRSNKRANIYNQGIRNMVLGREDELTRGDQLMIVKNNYYWAAMSPDATEEAEQRIAFLANGDRAVIQRVRNVREVYGFRFADITLQFPDYDHYELTVTALLDTLSAEAPALTREQHEQLYLRVMEDYEYITRKQDRLQKLKTDPFYNALQIKYAYAVTCHKAQGGQWEHVYVDQGYMTDEMLTPDYIHWLYTAFTRATGKLFLVNWPKEQTEENDAAHTDRH